MAQFESFRRPPIYARGTGRSGPRMAAELPVTLTDDGGPVTKTAQFLIAGPGDVERLLPGQVVTRSPHPGCVDAEETMMPFVELASENLPWRYSPDTPAAGALRPWLVLVVGTPADVTVNADEVTLSGTVFAAHPLAESHKWAHVHDVPGRTLCRILSPIDLATNTDYVAALVPGWRLVGDDLQDSWGPGTATVTLPCFDSWTFHTTPDPGDFKSIAARLEPLDAAEDADLKTKSFGRARVAVGIMTNTALSAGGALTAIPRAGEPPIAEPLPAAVATAVEPLTKNLTDPDGRWVLAMPRYDAPWWPGPVAGQPWVWPLPGDQDVPPGWRSQLRVDPRFRGAAGLGSWIGIAWQDRIADGAARQAGAVAAAAQRIRSLVIGLEAARGLWRNRMPDDPLAALGTLSVLLGRMPATTGGSALSAIAGRTPGLIPALFSSAAKRMLRRRGPLERAAQPGATHLGGLFAAANGCPAPQSPRPEDSAVIDRLRDMSDEQAGHLVWNDAFDALFGYYQSDQPAERVAASVDQHTAQLLVDIFRVEPPPPAACEPLPDLIAFANSVAAGIDPTIDRPVVVDRVLGPINGLRPPLLAEPDIAPELDIPLWRFLADNAPDWLLPGGGDIPMDRVLAVQSNPAFIDALLVGANVQTLGELRWRNIPITSMWTPLRRFWQRIDITADDIATDIKSIIAIDTGTPFWTDGTDLGDVSHLSDPAHGISLVVVFHTDLFRRYPSTAVYLTPNRGGPDPWADPVPDVDADPADRAYPSFSGTLTPELVFFGFDVAPSAAADHWVVLEEPPPGYRFRQDAAAAAAAGDAAVFARTTFATPVRVFLGNLLGDPV